MCRGNAQSSNQPMTVVDSQDTSNRENAPPDQGNRVSEICEPRSRSKLGMPSNVPPTRGHLHGDYIGGWTMSCSHRYTRVA